MQVGKAPRGGVRPAIVMAVPVSGLRSGALDGLRGFAALAVVFAHLVVYMGLLPFAPLGAMGVLVFFVLSGYLIALKCWSAPPTVASYMRFVRRRARRLLPACAALVLVGGPMLVVLGALPPTTVLRDGAFAMSQTTAFATAASVDTQPAFVPTWSLTVEWTFYLTFPVALFWLRRRVAQPTTSRKALTAAAAILYLVGLALDDRSFYLLPVANLGVMYAGAALALWHVERSEGPRAADNGRTALALVMLCILVLLPGHTIGPAWKFCILPVTTLCALVVIHACWAGNRTTRLLAIRPLRAVGLRAYSLYLWHVPVMWLAWVNRPTEAPAWAAIAALALATFVTQVSFTAFEKPVLQRAAGPKASGIVQAQGKPTIAPLET